MAKAGWHTETCEFGEPHRGCFRSARAGCEAAAFLAEDEPVNSLCKRLGEFVNVAYQFIMYTGSREDLVRSWVEFVHRLQVPDVD